MKSKNSGESYIEKVDLKEAGSTLETEERLDWPIVSCVSVLQISDLERRRRSEKAFLRQGIVIGLGEGAELIFHLVPHVKIYKFETISLGSRSILDIYCCRLKVFSDC